MSRRHSRTRRIDERSRRHPYFVEGPRVRLGDGQLWTIGLPSVEIDNLNDLGQPLRLCPTLHFRGEAPELEQLDRWLKSVLPEIADIPHRPEDERYAVASQLLALELYRNYDLSDDEAVSLLAPRSPKDPRTLEWLREAAQVGVIELLLEMAEISRNHIPDLARKLGAYASN